MLIDWFTVGAQALNFLVLVWLLKRFLYGPVLVAIDAREKRLALAMAEAVAQRTAAEQQGRELTDKNSALDAERDRLRAQAVRDADAERERLFAQVRAEAAALRAKEDAALREERARVGRDVEGFVQQEVLATARKALIELASASLEERMVEVFLERLRAMDPDAREALAAAANASAQVLVRSHFDVTEAQRTAIRRALDEGGARPVPLRFETSTDIVCGIELITGGRKVAWNVADYLESFERTLASVIGAGRKSAGGAAPPGVPAAQAAP